MQRAKIEIVCDTERIGFNKKCNDVRRMRDILNKLYNEENMPYTAVCEIDRLYVYEILKKRANNRQP